MRNLHNSGDRSWLDAEIFCILIGPAEFNFSVFKGNPLSWHFLERVACKAMQPPLSKGVVCNLHSGGCVYNPIERGLYPWTFDNGLYTTLIQAPYMRGFVCNPIWSPFHRGCIQPPHHPYFRVSYAQPPFNPHVTPIYVRNAAPL